MYRLQFRCSSAPELLHTDVQVNQPLEDPRIGIPALNASMEEMNKYLDDNVDPSINQLAANLQQADEHLTNAEDDMQLTDAADSAIYGELMSQLLLSVCGTAVTYECIGRLSISPHVMLAMNRVEGCRYILPVSRLPPVGILLTDRCVNTLPDDHTWYKCTKLQTRVNGDMQKMTLLKQQKS